MSTYNLIASDDQCTVVSEYIQESRRSDSYQSEAALEEEFIRMLRSQGYEYITIVDENGLVANLRTQLEILNGIRFSDSEWGRFFAESIASANDGIVEKTNRIQVDNVQILRRDDGSIKNITLIDKKDIHNNRLQVINQYSTDKGEYDNRYDVTVLVNGLPLIHIELKRRGVELREAFNQINRYQSQSFWSGYGLFEYIQIFVISNGTSTKYYSNTTRDSHIREMTASGRARSKKTSNSFEFTSFWADGNNRIIPDLVDFTKTFFARNTILNILTRYCIFTSENMLLVMRPYQIVATERILNRIETSNNYKRYGTKEAGGYIWHTTGSGKTLTSFKTAQLATRLPYVDKVLFVVDRKDLDYQTMREYDRFEKGAANGNNSTRILQKQLEDPQARIIVTTIQKLTTFISRNREHEVYQKHVVMIFDECHRSQFGEMHKAITRAFRKYHIFGFTGTPIFSVNASNGRNPTLKTTADAFGDKLHAYTIVNAINDGNVLPFLIDYVSTVKAADDIEDKDVPGIETESVMGSPDRISLVTSYILQHFDQKTKRNASYDFKGRKVMGFNSILAVSSIPMAMLYYEEFKKQMETTRKHLNIATIYTFSPNPGEDPDGTIYEGELTVDGMDINQRNFLERAIRDYNTMFKVNFDTSSKNFENYYKDISKRMKDRDLDLLIVVDMFLTGFDATTLNTLWVDKNLKMHGLIQAFSRTNRILNSVKTFGNIICFRKLRKRTDDALALFGDENASGTVLLKAYDDYYNGYDSDDEGHARGYLELVDKLLGEFPLGEPIIGEEHQKDFVRLFGSILRLQNILSVFDQYAGNEILSPREQQDYQSLYLDIHSNIRMRRKDKENVVDDLVFEMELIKQVEVNIDYILMLVKKYHDSNCTDKEILVDVERAIGSSTQLRSKRELIMQFISKVDESSDIDRDWPEFVKAQKETDLEEIIIENHLKPDDTRRFLDNSFRDGMIKTSGTEVDSLMPPMSRFGSGGKDRTNRKESIIGVLKSFFEKYFGLI
ncbi:MAG: type I restriction endonuclease subunit R [Candidatus Methanomethylophilaceae archaeon]|nr:type I restriction endonuclease subunit R [Candidatus Methanomethylophilaceae archaeon]